MDTVRRSERFMLKMRQHMDWPIMEILHNFRE